MKIGIAVPNFGKYATKDNITDIALAAEEYGFDSIWVSDHIVIPESHNVFGNNFYDPVSTLSYLASITTTITLGTSILVLPYRNPIVTAKAVTTIDQLSEGRLILGVGAGWLEDEFEALGANYENRWSKTLEYIDILQSLWYCEKKDYKGKYFSFSNISFKPRTYNNREIPIWLGGNSIKSINMAFDKCSGWHAVRLNADELMEKRKYIERKFEKTVTRRETFSISTRTNLQITDNSTINANVDEPLRGNKGKIIKGLSNYKSAGADHMIIYILSSNISNFINTMKTFANVIRPQID
ncbi:MAG TPA: LLM class flavin-dependent oxidoreductase [Thermodesulfobacteriota bacterium]|nr:LLM class flavin-dependent oxidoreductase [Thermodesulfobacteriota bacterium]